jgi:hypothetical protein
MIHRYAPLGLVISLVFSLGACRSAERQLLQGQYDTAFEQALQKLGGRQLRDEHILVLERAYALALDREMESIDLMRREGRPDRWPDIVRAYEMLQYRQQRLKPFLPLYITSEGRYARFEQPDLNAPLAEARRQASLYYYDEASRLLQSGQRLDARDAYALLDRMQRDLGPYRDSPELLERARQLGTDRVLVEWQQSPLLLPPLLWDGLRYTDLGPLQEAWTWYAGPESDMGAPDFRVVFRVLGAQVSPPWQQEFHFSESRDIEVEGGRFVVDSLGNNVAVPKIETIRADLVETQQRQSALLTGTMEIFSADGKRLYRQPLQGEFLWANTALRASGNLKALSPETQARLGGGVLPFPPPPALLEGAVGVFQQTALDQLSQQRQRFW